MSGGVFLVSVTRHQEVDDDVDVGTAILGRNGAYQLEAAQTDSLIVALCHQGFDESSVLSVAQRGRVETQVHVHGSAVGHVGLAQQQPGNGTADDRKLALEATEDLTDLDQH